VHRGQRQSTSGGDPVGDSVSALRAAVNHVDMDRSNWFLRVVGNWRRGRDLSRNFASRGRYPQPWNSALDWLIKSGRFIFAIALVVLGLDHFLFFRLVASLVPLWIPWHLFWGVFLRLRFHWLPA
jgi:hypothetical protein